MFRRSMTTRCEARRSKGGDAAGDDETQKKKKSADAAAFEDERQTDEDVVEVEAAGKKKQKRKSKKGSTKDSSSSSSSSKKTTTTVAKKKEDETAEQGEDAEQTETNELIEQVVNADADAERMESFALKKKRMELIIEEKEWDLESPTASADERYDRLLEYVNAVEAFKELCSSEVPNTVSDLLGQYVTVYHLPKGAAGHDEAMAFLDLEFDDEDEDGNKVTFTRRFEDIAVDDDDDEDDEDDEGEIWINFVVEDESGRFGADYDPENGLHCAQDVDGNWRWLEDDFGRVLPEKPFGDFSTKLMSVEYMLKIGLNVNSLHKEIDSEELIDFTGCGSWQDVIHASQEVTKALQEMEEDGWKVDPSWDSNYLVVVKELTPLQTMSSVFSDGPIKPKEEEEETA